MLLTADEGSRTVAAVLTPKMFRKPKVKKVSDGDSNSLSGSLCEYGSHLGRDIALPCAVCLVVMDA